jgi:UDP-GlcNAc:undecaprenyl-phosphate GlcNAc-1-phosphate transferase
VTLIACIGAPIAVLVLTGVAPWLGVKMLAASLVDSPAAQRTNFRGRVVFLGLGTAWIFWAAGMEVLRLAGEVPGWGLGLFTAIGAVAPLVISTLLFGLLDDAFGTSADRGFRGHLAALARGRLTTGAFKLLGIGLVSLGAAASIAPGPPSVHASPGVLAVWAGWTLVLGAIVALTANLVNLTDLRPGRALKSYTLVAVALVIGAAFVHSTGGAALLAIALVGPIVAVWRLDAGEHGMLGDAGANAAGAALGFVAAWECGRAWPALVVLGVVLAVNLASERWSFSRVIAGNRVLAWIDGLGRDADAPATSRGSAKSSPQSRASDG